MLPSGRSVRISRRGLGRIGMIVSLLATLGLVALLAKTDWQELIRPLLAAEPGWLLAALVTQLAVEVVKTLRWQLLLGLPAAALPELLAQVLGARLLNALAPLRAGDVWRVAFVARTQHRPLVTVGGSVLAEKLLDGAGLGALGLALLGSAGSDLVPALLLAAIALGGVVRVVGPRRPAGSPAWLERWTAELRHLGRPPVLLGVVALTVAGLGLGLLVNLLVLRGLALPSGLTAGATMLLAGYAVGVLPAGPGQLGLFELAVASPLVAAGFSPGQAVAAALALHLVLLATLALGGLLALPLGLLEQPQRRGAVAPDARPAGE